MDIKSTNDIINNIVMTKDLFSNCMLFSQFVKEPFTSRTHSGQKEILDKMLSLEKYDEYYDKITNIIKETNFEEIERKIKNFIWLKEMDENGHEEIIRNYNEFKETTLQKINDIENRIKGLNVDLDKTSKLFSEELYNTLKKKIDDINFSIMGLTNQLNTIDTNLENEKQNKIEFYKNKMKEKEIEIKEKYIDKKESLEKEINRITKEEEKALSNIESQRIHNNQLLEQSSSSQQIQCGNVRDEFNSLVSDKRDETHLLLNKYQEELNIKESNYLRADNELNNLKDNINRSNNELASLDVNNSKNCPLCKQEIIDENHKKHIKEKISKLKKDIKDYELKVNELSKNIKTLSADKEIASNNITILKRKYEDYENKMKDSVDKKIDTIYKSYEKNKNELIEKIKNLIEEYDTRTNNIAVLTADLNEELNKIQESITTEVRQSNTNLKSEYDLEIKSYNEKIIVTKNELQNSISDLKVKLNFENEKLQTFEYNKQTVNNIQLNLKELSLEQNHYNEKLKTEKDSFDKKCIDFKTRIDSVNNNIKLTEKEKGEIQEKIDILNFWKKGFSDIGIKSILLDESIPILNKRARELSNLTNNIRVTFSSQSTLKSGKNNNKFSIDAVHSTNLSEYQDFSAGETRMANIIVLLCLRHLLEIMAGKTINILLLDEILDSLDDDNSEIAVDIMRSLSKEFLVMIISHSHKSWIVSDNDIRL
jgi:DNA repair exonuclease SbcCD ATPase subunit